MLDDDDVFFLEKTSKKMLTLRKNIVPIQHPNMGELGNENKASFCPGRNMSFE